VLVKKIFSSEKIAHLRVYQYSRFRPILRLRWWIWLFINFSIIVSYVETGYKALILPAAQWLQLTQWNSEASWERVTSRSNRCRSRDPSERRCAFKMMRNLMNNSLLCALQWNCQYFLVVCVKQLITNPSKLLK